MSTIHRENKRCALCGSISQQVTIKSTNEQGAYDLDGRPPEMRRSTMKYWIQECPACGYVWDDVSKSNPDIDQLTPGLLEREGYKKCDGITFKTELAERFYRKHIICMDVADRKEAFYSLLCAAWACDDAGDTANAIWMRSMAVAISSELVADMKKIHNDKQLENIYMIRADLLRRVNCFDTVFYEYNSPIIDAIPISPNVKNTLRYQVYLAWKRDNKTYNFKDSLTFARKHTHKIPYFLVEDGMRKLKTYTALRNMERFFNGIEYEDYKFIVDCISKNVSYWSDTNLLGEKGDGNVTKHLFKIAENLGCSVKAVPAVITAVLYGTNAEVCRGETCLALFYDNEITAKQLCFIKENEDGLIDSIFLSQANEFEYEIISD